MTKLLLFFILIPIIIISEAREPLNENFGDGDWHVYPHWINSDNYCYDFIDTHPYHFARVHVDYDRKTGEYGILKDLHLKECVTVARYNEKNVIIHLYDAPTHNHLSKLASLLGEEFYYAWLHFDLPADWKGEIFVEPFETVVLSILRENERADYYTDLDIQILSERVKKVKGTNIQRVIQLNENMVKMSRDVSWKNLINLVNYTIVYNEHKTGQKKDDILSILQSPIVFTIWDTDVLSAYNGKESQFKNVKDFFGPH